MDIDYCKYHRDSDYEKYESMFKNIFMKRFNLLRPYIKTGKVLDIGASTGTFLDLFKVKGWETWGIEPSISSEIAKSKGHKIIDKYFEKAQLSNNYFDLVIMNHTLEHLENPKLVLHKVYKILKKDGVLLVDVPNVGSLLSKLLGKRWPYRLPIEHKWQFTKDSLVKVFNKAGFKVLHWESRSGIFEYANPLLELKRRRFILDLIAMPYSLIATFLNMGDSMSLIGKK